MTAAVVTGNTKMTFTSGKDPKVTVTGANLSQLNNIADATEGAVTASISGSVTDLTHETTGLQTNNNDDITITATGDATIAELKTLDAATSASSISVTVRDSAAALRSLIVEGSNVYTPLLSQATKIEITDYNNEDLSALASLSGNDDPTLHLIIDQDNTLNNTAASYLTAFDKIVLENDATQLTLPGEAFITGDENTIYLNSSKLTSFESSDDNTKVIISDASTSGDNLDLSNITSVTGISEILVNGDTGQNVIQLSQALLPLEQQLLI